MSKTLNKYITALDYADKNLLVLSSRNTGVSLYSFTIVIGAPVEIASANLSLVILIANRIFKMSIETIRTKKTKKDCFISQKGSK